MYCRCTSSSMAWMAFSNWALLKELMTLAPVARVKRLAMFGLGGCASSLMPASRSHGIESSGSGVASWPLSFFVLNVSVRLPLAVGIRCQKSGIRKPVDRHVLVFNLAHHFRKFGVARPVAGFSDHADDGPPAGWPMAQHVQRRGDGIERHGTVTIGPYLLESVDQLVGRFGEIHPPLDLVAERKDCRLAL